MKLLEQTPQEVREKIQRVLSSDEEELICVSTDLNREGKYDTQWVVATDKRVMVVPNQGADGVVDVPISELTRGANRAPGQRGPPGD